MAGIWWFAVFLVAFFVTTGLRLCFPQVNSKVNLRVGILK